MLVYLIALGVFGPLLVVLYFILSDIFYSKKRVFKYFDKIGVKKRLLLSISTFIIIVSLWSLLSYGGIVERQFLASPSNTIESLFESLISGELLVNVSISLLRIIIGFLTASLIGVLLGSLAGTFTKFYYLIIPFNSSIRYIPPPAFIGLTIIWFGVDEASKIVLIFIGIVFYITQMVYDVVSLVPKLYIEAAQTLGANRYEIFSRVVLSFSIPEIIAVLRVNLGAAWTFLVVAELIAAQKGIGYLMAVSQRFLDTPKLFAMIVIVGVLGFFTDWILSLLIRFKLRWK